jgi:hypothetical protein
MGKKFLTIFVILIVAVFITAYFIINREEETQTADNGEQPTPTINIVEGWETSTSEKIGFTISHPADAEIIDREDVLAILFLGPTQTLGTEIFDGYSLNFTTGSYNTQNLEEFVNLQRQEAEEDMVISRVGEIQNISVAGINGYRFSQTGLGEFTLLYLPRGQDMYLLVAMLVEDPTGAGFEQTVDTILSTLVIH